MTIPVLIGVTCAQEEGKERACLSKNYYEVLLEFGALPVLLPPTAWDGAAEGYAELVDGLLLSGGADLDPVFFGEEPLPSMGEINPERDFFEMSLTRKILNLKKPVLAICRGIQVLNVAAGGSIKQDLGPNRGNVKHMQDAPRWYPTHGVSLSEGSRLSRTLGDQTHIRVNSFHHQAVKQVAPGFVVSARASDGVIEAIETRWEPMVVGVQWHPECMWGRDAAQKEIFNALVESAKESRKQ